MTRYVTYLFQNNMATVIDHVESNRSIAIFGYGVKGSVVDAPNGNEREQLSIRLQISLNNIARMTGAGYLT